MTNRTASYLLVFGMVLCSFLHCSSPAVADSSAMSSADTAPILLAQAEEQEPVLEGPEKGVPEPDMDADAEPGDVDTEPEPAPDATDATDDDQPDTPPSDKAPDKQPGNGKPKEDEEEWSTPESTKGEPPKGAALTKEPGKKVEGNIVVHVEDVDLDQVVKMFMLLTDANIIANSTNLVGKTVTVNLSGVPWKPALTQILAQHKMRMDEQPKGSGIYTVVPIVPGEIVRIPKTIFLKYAAVGEVEGLVNKMMLPGGTVSLFPSRNCLVVVSTEDNLTQIEKIIREIDILREQVIIGANFLELTKDAMKDVGIKWDALRGYTLSATGMKLQYEADRQWTDKRTDLISQWDKRQRVDQLSDFRDSEGAVVQLTEYETIPISQDQTIVKETPVPARTIEDTIDLGRDVSADVEDSFVRTISDLRSAVLGAKDFQILISALEDTDGVEVVSSPKILVANEQSALIHIGQTERPFVSKITPSQQGIAPIVVYTPGEAVDLGVKLTVTPNVNTKSNITVRIAPELTRFVRDAVAPNGQTYPIVATKKIDTIFCLESGRTAAIGGLIETKDRDVTTKVPLLGDIPLLGKYLFTHVHKEKAQQETIIFVTVKLAPPRTIQERDAVPDREVLTSKHLEREKILRRRRKEELDKHVDALKAADKRRESQKHSRLLHMFRD